MTTDITIKKELSKYEVRAVEIVIKTDDDMQSATLALSEINKILDAATKEKEKVTKPLNEALKVERNRWKPIEDACSAATALIKSKMIAYRRHVDAENAKKEAAIIARTEKGTLKPETAVAKLENLPDASKTVTSDAGLVKWREVTRLVIDDANKIPREYLDVNETMVKAALKAGTTVPGARLVTEKEPINFR